jgi:hypothetical protein
MTFSASTCLTDLSGANLTDPIKFYSDVNNFLFEFNSANLSQLTGSSCPFILTNIPDGTKVVKIISENNYCANIDVEKLDCGFFNFQLITNNDVSRIIATALKSSNVEPTDYKINWYGPNNTTNLVFSSGKGNKYTYDFTYPINQPVEGGTYFPVVENVFIDNKSFSNTGGTGNIYTDLENCLKPEIIQPCSCGNRTAPLGNKYNHSYSYQAQANVTPVPITVSLILTANTKYFAWSFQGITKPDRITIYLSGSSYSTLIGLDDLIVGDELSSDSFNINDFPKSADTKNYVNKIVNLEKFTINANDKIIFKITPSSVDTGWNLLYSCLSDAKCPSCFVDTSYFKISENSIKLTYDSQNCVSLVSLSILKPCDESSDFFKFMNSFPYFYQIGIQTDPPGNVSYSTTLNLETQICGYDIKINNTFNTCSNTSTPFTYIKSVDSGKAVHIFTGDTSVINTYYVQIINAIQTYSGTTTTDNTQKDYYNYITIQAPSGGNLCPDNVTYKQIGIPVNSIITKSLDGKTLTIKPQTLTYNPAVLNTIPSVSCSNCQTNWLNVVNSLNNSTNDQSNSLITIQNGYPTNLVNYFWKASVSIQPTISASTFVGYYLLNNYFLNTIPFSGNNNTLIPSLSASTCPNLDCGISSGFFKYNYKYYYTIKYVNLSDPTAFKIYTSPINNCIPDSNTLNEIYFYSGGTVVYKDPNYII